MQKNKKSYKQDETGGRVMHKLEKILNIFSIIVFLAMIVFFIIVIYIIIDFKNDYDCSTTYDSKWYIEHNCGRYEKSE